MKGFIKKHPFRFDKLIKEWPLQYKYIQKYVAAKLGINYKYYQAYELGIAVPTLQNFLKIALFYDIFLDHLIDSKKY